jgi:hypothetical protein
MNKVGSSAFVYLMFAILFGVLGMALAPALLNTSSEARTLQVHPSNSSDTWGLDCSNESISYQDKTACTSIDVFPSMYVGLIFGLIGILIVRMAG